MAQIPEYAKDTQEYFKVSAREPGLYNESFAEITFTLPIELNPGFCE